MFGFGRLLGRWFDGGVEGVEVRGLGEVVRVVFGEVLDGFGVAQSMLTAQQRLCGVHREQRSLGAYRHDPPNAQAAPATRIYLTHTL